LAGLGEGIGEGIADAATNALEREKLEVEKLEISAKAKAAQAAAAAAKAKADAAAREVKINELDLKAYVQGVGVTPGAALGWTSPSAGESYPVESGLDEVPDWAFPVKPINELPQAVQDGILNEQQAAAIRSAGSIDAAEKIFERLKGADEDKTSAQKNWAAYNQYVQDNPDASPKQLDDLRTAYGLTTAAESEQKAATLAKTKQEFRTPEQIKLNADLKKAELAIKQQAFKTPEQQEREAKLAKAQLETTEENLKKLRDAFLPGASVRELAEHKLKISKAEADLERVRDLTRTAEERKLDLEQKQADLNYRNEVIVSSEKKNILLGAQVKDIGADEAAQKRVGSVMDIADMPGYKFLWSSKHAGHLVAPNGTEADGSAMSTNDRRGVHDSITRNTRALSSLFQKLEVQGGGVGKVVVDYTKMTDAEAVIANQYQIQTIALKKMLQVKGQALLGAAEMIDFQATKQAGDGMPVYFNVDGTSTLFPPVSPSGGSGNAGGPDAGQAAIDAAAKRAQEARDKLKKAAGGDN
jgi:hypothetical protein